MFDDFSVQSVPKIMSGLACYSVRFALIMVGIIMVYSGVAFIIGRGNPAALASAKKGFLYSVIGALIIFGVYTIILTVAAYFGVTNLPWIPLICP